MTAAPVPRLALELIIAGFRLIPLVALARQLSNPSSPLLRALSAYRNLDVSSAVPPATPRVSIKRARRLNQTELAALANGYRAGATVYDLAAKFGINRKTVSSQLKALEVPMRRTSLTDGELTQAIALYRSGLSVANVGERLERHHSVVGHALQRAGVQRRDSQEGEVAES